MDADWVDRPRPRFPWPIWILVAGFLAFFVSFPFREAGIELMSVPGLIWTTVTVITALLIGWSYFGVRYELGQEKLLAVAGFSRAQLDIGAITGIDIIPWYTFVLPRNWGMLLVNSWQPVLRIVDSSGRKLLLTPTDPEEMRAEILRRRDRLRGDSDA